MRLSALYLFLLLAACTTEGTVEPLMKAVGPLPAEPVWSVRVGGCVKASDCNALRTALVGRLLMAKFLQRALPQDQPAPLALDVAVVHFHAVPDAARNQRGLLAGRNEIRAVVTVRDAKGTALRSFRIEVEGGSYPFDDGSSIQDAYRNFDNQVLAALKS